LIAVDGKTRRCSHDKKKGVSAIDMVSAYASEARLVLAEKQGQALLKKSQFSIF